MDRKKSMDDAIKSIYEWDENNVSKTVIINKTSVSSEIIATIKTLLHTENLQSKSTSTSKVDLTIIIGKDYK